jgi:hypothetical protein
MQVLGKPTAFLDQRDKDRQAPGKFNVIFTRGFVSSQAVARERKKLQLEDPPPKPGGKNWFEEDYVNARKIRDRSFSPRHGTTARHPSIARCVRVRHEATAAAGFVHARAADCDSLF